MTTKPARIRLSRLAGLGAMLLVAAGAVMPAPALGDDSQCRAIEDATARLHCYESLLRSNPEAPASVPLSSASVSRKIGNWQLIRTPNPREGKEAISITRAGELSGSDPDFAGLMIRCADPDIEVLAVLISPQSPRTHPRVSINGTKFESSVVPPGTAILLPAETATLARKRWPALASLLLKIERDGAVTKGLVSLDGLQAALAALTVACATRR